ncbi:MAG: phosphoglucosamine mutase [Gammaproteobacteria bacterium]|nr:MAG: phosphoglucosamine mutase [Gammaproteobacteria bacterium]
MGKKKYFGTDGIRGEVGQYPITPGFMLKLGWAAGKVFAENSAHRKVLIGKDTRISGYMFESALEAGLSAAGVDVSLLGPMPTPAIAYLTRTFRANAGIVISASHNPHFDNGIKFFSSEGAKLDDEVELRIEKYIDRDMDVVASHSLGKAARIDDAAGRYVEFCKSAVPSNVRFDGLRIVLDCAHGATYHVAPLVFAELGVQVDTIGTSPDGLNINKAFGSTSPEALVREVLEQKADLGIAFDGDGDRVIMVDDKGEVVDGDELLFIIAKSLNEAGRLNGGVVGTLMTNFGAEMAFKELAIPFERVKVGDRYVMERLISNGWTLGGEGSGHIVCRQHTTTGDAIISALQVLIAIQESDKTLAELKSGMTKLPQRMINVRLADKKDPMANDEVCRAVAEVEAELGGNGRVLLRASGTEPVVRVMTEGTNPQLIERLAEKLAGIVEKALG